jgi:nucleotide-binding universal stress UspA family protein
MVDRHTVVAAYNATEEAADGLALARLLAGLTDSDVLIVRVLERMVDTAVPDRATQATVRESIRRTRRALVAALPGDGEGAQIVPIMDTDLARGLHEAAAANDAGFLVLGSTHHSAIGRMLIGGSADLVVNHAPCPVAVAPPGFRDAPELRPGVIGCGYDGSPESIEALREAIELAATGGLPVRIMTAGRDLDPMLDEAAEFTAQLGHESVPVGQVALQGKPADALIAETDGGVGMLVMGSRSQGPLRRAVLGSVSARVLHHARCPVLVVPRRH